MKSEFLYTAMLQYSPQQIKICIRKRQAKHNSPESTNCRTVGLFDMGKGWWKMEIYCQKNMQSKLALFLILIPHHVLLDTAGDRARKNFGLAHWLNFGREGQLHQGSQVREKWSAGHCQSNTCFKIWSTDLQCRKHRDRERRKGWEINTVLKP